MIERAEAVEPTLNAVATTIASIAERIIAAEAVVHALTTFRIRATQERVRPWPTTAPLVL